MRSSHNKTSSHSKRPFLTTNSLITRFVLASLIILPLFIILSGTLLLNAFQHSQIESEEEKLQAHLYLLLSATEVDDRTILLPTALTDPRFNQQNSGLYAFIYDKHDRLLWQSPSALLIHKKHFHPERIFITDQRLFMPARLSSYPLSPNQFLSNDKQIDDASLLLGDGRLSTLSYDVEWINDDDSSIHLRLVIASDATPLVTEIKSYRQRLWHGLGLMGILLIISQLFIMRWGLKPLKRLLKELELLRQNKLQQLNSNYPIEIQPVINNFNTIVHQEKQQRERYKNTMADLAHSVKTPLAVIQSQLSDSHWQTADINATNNHHKIIGDQVQRINQIIGHQLQRAVVKVNQNPMSDGDHQLSVKSTVNRLRNILLKVYQEPIITIDNRCTDEDIFYGNEADLLEVLGNLLDNACKHGSGQVMITTSDGERSSEGLSIHISDNGAGVDQHLQHTILQRGERADTIQPGQGIGLSVAVDIMSSYDGEVSVRNNAENPHLSGACFTVSFPQKTKAK